MAARGRCGNIIDFRRQTLYRMHLKYHADVMTNWFANTTSPLFTNTIKSDDLVAIIQYSKCIQGYHNGPKQI